MTSDSAPQTLRPDLSEVARLEQDERVEWVGKPEARATVRWSLYRKIMLFTVVLALISSYNTVLALLRMPDNPLAWCLLLSYTVLPCLVIGLIGKYQETVASDTVYAITNKRALIFVGRRMREFKSVYYLDTVERSDGYKDLVMDRISTSKQSSSEKTRIGFLGLTAEAATFAQPLLVAALNPPLVRTLSPQQDIQIFNGQS